jgi:hypothetical protein
MFSRKEGEVAVPQGFTREKTKRDTTAQKNFDARLQRNAAQRGATLQPPGATTVTQ